MKYAHHKGTSQYMAKKGVKEIKRGNTLLRFQG